MEKETLKLNLHDKVVIEDRFGNKYEEEIYEVFEYNSKTYCYRTENFELNIHAAGRTFILCKSLDKDQKIDYDFKIIKANRLINVIENGIYKTIDVTFWENGKYIDLIDLSKYGEYLQLVKEEDIYKRKYEDLVCLLSCAKKQISLNGRNNVQSIVLDFSEMNPDRQQEIYELITKEK